MKANQFVLLLVFLMLGKVAAQQTNLASGDSETLATLKVLAEKGNANWQYVLGGCYAQGIGVTQSDVEAVKWYRKAAAQGNVEAQFCLGVCYAFGKGVPQDYSEAINCYRKAADQGDAEAQFNLGVCYINGRGVSQDNAEAVKWYRKAADQGHAAAQFNLGQMYRQGEGVPQDYAEAAKWYRRAADQGLADAQYNLSLNYRKGQGVPQNDIEAYTWSSLAAAQGEEDAAQNRDTFASRMSREEIAEGQRRTAAFVPHKEAPSSNSGNSISPTNPAFSGTGFFITNDGYLISNYHVVKDAAKVRLLTAAGFLAAAVVKVDTANDLALLKVNIPVPPPGLVLEHGFSPLPIVASRSVKLGGTVATVGFPDTGLQGFAPKLAKGEIASLSGAADDPRYFQISVPVQPGNSGGALVDARGNVVGIVTAKLDASLALAATGSLPENVNYAVKSSLLLSFLESVPDVAAKLKEPNTKDEAFEEAVKSAQNAAVLVLVY